MYIYLDKLNLKKVLKKQTNNFEGPFYSQRSPWDRLWPLSQLLCSSVSPFV